MKNIVRIVLIGMISIVLIGYTEHIESHAPGMKRSGATHLAAHIKSIVYKAGYVGNITASTLAGIWLLQHQEIPPFLAEYMVMTVNRGTYLVMRGLIATVGLSMLYVTWA